MFNRLKRLLGVGVSGDTTAKVEVAAEPAPVAEAPSAAPKAAPKKTAAKKTTAGVAKDPAKKGPGRPKATEG